MVKADSIVKVWGKNYITVFIGAVIFLFINVTTHAQSNFNVDKQLDYCVRK